MKSTALKPGFAVEILRAFVLVAALTSDPARAAWLDGFACRRQIEVDCSKIDAPLTNFPALLRLTTNNFDFAKARPDGFDLRFAAADGSTLLAHERERHDEAAEAAEYWVKLPLVADDSNTVFYMYYGSSPAADGADAVNVWDAHFAGVWHQDDLTASSIRDSTTNANNAAKRAVNEPTEADGKIGKAQSLDGNNDYARLPEPPTASTRVNTGSVFAWIKTSNAGTSYRGIAVKQSAYGMFFRDNEFGVYDWGNTTWRGSGVNLADGEWHFVGFTFENIDAASPSNNAKLYVDGGYTTTVTIKLSNHNEGVVFGAGDNPASIQFFQGFIDEVRVSNIARSLAWIEADFHSGNGTLLFYGGEQPCPAGFFNLEFF